MSFKMRHTIDAEELDAWRNRWEQFAASFSADGHSQKRFEVNLHEGTYRVTSHGKTVYYGASKITAITKYNGEP